MIGEPGGARNTVVTVVLSVFVLLLLLALIVPRLISREGGGISEVHSNLAAMGRLIETFKLDTGRYPTDEEGLEALRIQPDGAKGWQGPYMTRPVPLDPWGRPFVYRTTVTPSGPSFELLSFGADETEGGTGEDEDVVERGSEFLESH
jgi:general secretion pathway protein G